MDKESVYLRPMTLEDSEQVVGWRNKEFVRKNFIYQKLFTVEGQREWYLTQVKTGNVAQFIVCLRGGREVGSTYLRDIDREKGTAEYGIFLGEKDILGQGIGTLAAQDAGLRVWRAGTGKSLSAVSGGQHRSRQEL